MADGILTAADFTNLLDEVYKYGGSPDFAYIPYWMYRALKRKHYRGQRQMVYRRIISRPKWGSLYWGFDKQELLYFAFQLDFCLQHRYLDFSFAAFGVSIDAQIYEPDERTAP